MRFFTESLDFDVHARGKIELHERVHRLRGWLKNVEQPLVRADLKLLARFLVHVRRAEHAILIFHRGQWDRTCDLCPGSASSVDDLARGLIQDAVVVRFKPNANSFFSNHVSLSRTFQLTWKERSGGKLQAAICCGTLARLFLVNTRSESRGRLKVAYCTISAIVPAPTVWPPSRIAKRNPFSIATGVISSIVSDTLSPGITISVPAGNSATPVTSVVRR
jgi:hypothetical protein